MKNLFLLTILIVILIANSSAQFYTTATLYPGDVYQVYSCPTRCEKAKDNMKAGAECRSYDLPLAMVYFKGAIMLDSLFCDAYDFLAKALIEDMQYDSALKVINKSLEINYANYGALEMKCMLLKQLKYYNQLVVFYNLMSKQQPQESTWLHQMALSLIELNKLDSAQEVVVKMQSLMTEQGIYEANTTSWYLQGIIAYKMGKYESALRAFDKVYDTYNNSAEFCYYYGKCYLNSTEPEIKQAKKYISRALMGGYKVEDEVLTKLDLK